MIGADPAGGVLRRREDQPERRGVLREDDARHPDRHAGGVPARAARSTTRPRRCPTLAKVPTLIACGDRDLLTPMEYSQSMAAALPKSELVIVGGAGHLVQLEQARGHRRRPGPACRAGHPVQAGRAHAAGAEPGAQTWLSAAPAPPSWPTAEDTIALGAQLGGQLRAGDVVVLSGPLGAGKTVLAKGIARAMDVDGPVTSPTFVLARVHRARRAGAPAMIHVDVYRLLDHAGCRPARRARLAGPRHRSRRRRRRRGVGRGPRRTALGQSPRHPARTRTATPKCAPRSGSGAGTDEHAR